MVNHHITNEDLKKEEKEIPKPKVKNELDFLPTTEYNLSNIVLN